MRNSGNNKHLKQLIGISDTLVKALKWAAMALVMVAVASPAFAATTGALKGTVEDSDGLPVPSVTITLTGVSLIGGSQERSSDMNGSYSFVQLPPGTYEISAVKPGFASIT